MTHSDFSILLERRLNLIKSTLDSKSKEYSSGEDRLHNFVYAAQVSGQSPALCLQGMLLKHLISYFDMIKKLDKGEKFDRKLLDEKFGDIINYFILQEAIFVEYWLKETPQADFSKSGYTPFEGRRINSEIFNNLEIDLFF